MVNKMKARLKEVMANSTPKTMHIYIKKDKMLYEAIMQCYGDTLSEKAYNLLHEPGVVCTNGNARKFISITHGYRNCGLAAVCKCTRDSVSANVSATKKSATVEEIAATNAKRDATNMKKYGVTNIGQIPEAKAAHKALYVDKDRVAEINARVKSTKKDKYGNENYNNPSQISSTFIANHPPEYWANRLENPKLMELRDVEVLLEMAMRLTTFEMAESLNVHPNTVAQYVRKYRKDLGIDDQQLI